MMRSQNAVIVVPFLFITSSDGGGKSLCLSQFSLSGSLQNRQIVFSCKKRKEDDPTQIPSPSISAEFEKLLLLPSSSFLFPNNSAIPSPARPTCFLGLEGGEAKKLSSFRNVASFLSFFLFPFPRKTVSLKRRQDLRVFP